MIDLVASDARLVASLNRPPQNVLDDALADAIERAIEEADRLGATVLHLRSATSHFCGGASVERIGAWLEPDGARALHADGDRWSRLFARLEASPAIVLAEIRGNALGAGLGLALACDLRIGATSAKFGVPEVRFGTLPAGMTTRRLVDAAGLATAQRLLLAGEVVDGVEAHRLGLLHWVVDDAEIASRADELARKLAGQSRAAGAAGKALLASALRESTSDGQRTEADAFERLLSHEEPRERLRALHVRLTSPKPPRA